MKNNEDITRMLEAVKIRRDRMDKLVTVTLVMSAINTAAILIIVVKQVGLRRRL